MARIKKVFSDISSIAHLWANKLQDEARTPTGNYYFDGLSIFSYGRHFEIAKHVKNEAGIEAVLFTESTYSVTTSKQVHVTYHAASHLNIIKCYEPSASHSSNFEYWLKEAEEQVQKLTSARKPEIYISNIGYIKTKVEKYANFFSIEIPALLVEIFKLDSKDNEYYSKKLAYLKEKEAKERKELKKAHAEALQNWYEGKTTRLYVNDGKDYLRLKDGRIETTQGVQIPLEIGRRFYANKIENNALQVGDKLLYYYVREVGKIIKIGCHTFDRSYIVKFAESIF